MVIVGVLLFGVFTGSVFGVILNASEFNKPEAEPDPYSAKVSFENVTLQKRIDALIKSGMEDFNDGNFSSALTILESAKLLVSNQLTTELLQTLNECYLITGNYQKSIELAKELIEKEPADPSNRTRLGLSYLLKGEYGEAKESFEAALEMDEHERSALLYLGLLYRLTNQSDQMEEAFKRAKEEYEQVLLVNDQDLPTLIEYATLNIYWEKDLDKADELIKQARKALDQRKGAPSQPLLSHFYIPMLEGMILTLKGNYHESLLHLTYALENAPPGIHSDLAKLYYFIGRDYAALTQPAVAAEFYRRSLEIHPEFIYAKEMRDSLSAMK